jgi:hypothetical protein
MNPENLKVEYDSADGGPAKPAVFKAAFKLCGERYAGLYRTESNLYGAYGDWTGLIDDAKSCMLRHGIRINGWRQRDGRLTAYPISPKYLDY